MLLLLLMHRQTASSVQEAAAQADCLVGSLVKSGLPEPYAADFKAKNGM